MLGFFAVAQKNVPYHFFEEVFLIWQLIVLEQHLLRSPNEWMSVTIEHNWVLTVTRSFLLMVAKCS